MWNGKKAVTLNYTSCERIEEICKTVSNKEDIFYGTNSEVF